MPEAYLFQPDADPLAETGAGRLLDLTPNPSTTLSTVSLAGELSVLPALTDDPTHTPQKALSELCSAAPHLLLAARYGSQISGQTAQPFQALQLVT